MSDIKVDLCKWCQGRSPNYYATCWDNYCFPRPPEAIPTQIPTLVTDASGRKLFPACARRASPPCASQHSQLIWCHCHDVVSARSVQAAQPADVLALGIFIASHGLSQSAGFGNWFRDQCNEAGLPKHCSAHGLRKAACRRLAEAGCTAHQIAAISGHASLREVERYTKAVDQARLAKDAIRKEQLRTSSGKPGA
jgi:hypothetical protein